MFKVMSKPTIKPVKSKVMKTRSEKRFQAMSDEEIKDLTLVVKETIANVKPRRFGAIHMWHLQRRTRTMVQKRQYFS